MDSQKLLEAFHLSNDSLQLIRIAGEKLFPFILQVVDDFYAWASSKAELIQYFEGEEHINRAKQLHIRYWKSFWAVSLDEYYIQSRYLIGQTHVRVGIPQEQYIQGKMVFRYLFEQLFLRLDITDFNTNVAFSRLLELDTWIVIDSYNKAINETLQSQNDALAEMSTPVAQLWENILFLPLVGILDSQHAQKITAAILEKIAFTQSKAFVLDISGIAAMDTAIANHIIKITKAARLMGCLCFISGVSPSVAQTVVDLGINTEEVRTTGNLKDALQSAFRLLGMQVTHL